MDTNEELLTCFQTEINEIAEAKIRSLRNEMEQVKQRIQEELKQDAQEQAERWYCQEEEELCSLHAVTMSHLNDENHHRLMKERDDLVTGLFEQVKEQLLSYHHSDAYETALEEKLDAIMKKGNHPTLLQVGKVDEDKLTSLLARLHSDCKGEIVSDIKLGGFRLILGEQGRILDETYDSAWKEAHEHFLQTSGLTIES